MKKSTEWMVRADLGPRPAGPADECFYCHRTVGDQHAPDCAIRNRMVIIRATVEYPIRVPEDWNEGNILFHRNEGSWCSSNFIAEVERVDDEMEGCLCGHAEFSYVREAAPEDAEAFSIVDVDEWLEAPSRSAPRINAKNYVESDIAG